MSDQIAAQMPEKLFAEVLRSLGFDGDREMGQTPSAFVGMLSEFVPAAEPPALATLECPPGSGPVVIRDLPFHSLCAHHLLPFFGTADVAYLPGDVVAGLGGVARALHHFARRPQLQERLGSQLADFLQGSIRPACTVVRLRARQLCMEMRGARSAGTVETWAHTKAHEDARELAHLLRGG